VALQLDATAATPPNWAYFSVPKQGRCPIVVALQLDATAATPPNWAYFSVPKQGRFPIVVALQLDATAATPPKWGILFGTKTRPLSDGAVNRHQVTAPETCRGEENSKKYVLARPPSSRKQMLPRQIQAAGVCGCSLFFR
jgi:hypothetical protein